MNVKDKSILRNSKATSGSAILAESNAIVNLSGGTITGNTASNADGGAINTGNSAVLNFSGSPIIYDNLDSSGSQKNVVLAIDRNNVIHTTSNGLSENAYIGVYVVGSDATNARSIYNGHGRLKDDFGTYGSDAGNENLDRFVNDRNGCVGEVDSDKTGTLIRWAKYICQITNVTGKGTDQEEHTLLYYQTGTGTKKTYVQAKFISLGAAYKALNKLYVKDGNTYTPYSAKKADWNETSHNTHIEMLVPEYEMQQSADRKGIDWGSSYKLTLTTAPEVKDDVGEPVTAVIYRGTVTSTYMFHLNYSIDSIEMSMENITIDGRTNSTQTEGYTMTGEGALFHMHGGTLTLNDGATLQNGIASSQGGAVFINGANAQVVMNEGSVIQSCAANGAGNYAGGAVCLNNGVNANEAYGFIMNGGTITGCSAPNGRGGALAVGHDDNALINGGTITGCSAKLSGGAVEVHGDVYMTGGTITGNTCTEGGAVNFWDEHNDDGSGRIFFSGSPRIYGNTNSTDKKERNVDTEKIQSCPPNKEIHKINVNGTLNSDAQVGVWAPDTQDSEGEHFGTYTTAPQDNFSIFRNDKYTGLVGKDGGNKELIWGPVICKIVDTNAANGRKVETTNEFEHVFTTLNAAVQYARDGFRVGEDGMDSKHPVKIEMLVDYVMPDTDTVTVTSTDEITDYITLTTAPTATEDTAGKWSYHYTGSTTSGTPAAGTKATILRGYTGKSMFTVNGGDNNTELTITGLILDGNMANYKANTNGGIVNVTKGTLNVQDGATLQNSIITDNNGKKVNGAGIYLADRDAYLNLSGEISFGKGNFKNESLSKQTNGGESYGKPRQDIYLAGYLGKNGENPKRATSLRVTGELVNKNSKNDGSIWVWAETPEGKEKTNEDNHYEQLKQFALFSGDGEKLEEEKKISTMKVFRNAVADELTGGSEPLYGEFGDEDTSKNYIYWSGVQGSRKVILKKVEKGSNLTLRGAKFKIYKGSTEVKGVDINGNANVTEFTSGANGVFYIGMMDYGAYVLQETQHPEGYSGASYFYLVVDEEGTEVSDKGFNKMEDASAKSKEVFAARKTARTEKRKSA